MATSITGIWNQIVGRQGLNSANAVASEASTGAGSNSDGSGAATITANDFLTLLVTEMKNQDPTANTDPNEYINQLVQVNSLQQLISINQTLTSDSSPKASSVASVSSAVGTAAGSKPALADAASIAQHNPPAIAAPIASGNLTVPKTDPAAHRVAQALAVQFNRQ